MWDVRNSGLADDASTYRIYAIVTSGTDAAVVNLNSEESMQMGTQRLLRINHDSYFLPIAPVEGEVANLGDGDTYTLKWEAYDMDATSTDLTVGAFMVAEGTNLDTDDDGVVTWAEFQAQTTCAWLTTSDDGTTPVAYANAAIYSDGNVVIDAGPITDNLADGGGGSANPSGNYDVYFVYDDDNDANDTWDAGSSTIIKSDGKLYFSDDTDLTGNYNFRLEPTVAVLEKNDTLTVSVVATDGGNDAMWLETYLNVPSEYFEVVDQAPSVDGIQPFVQVTTTFSGSVTRNLAAMNGTDYELDFAAHYTDYTTVANLASTVIATFQLVAKFDAVGDVIDNTNITFNTTGERVCHMVDANWVQYATTVKPIAAVYGVSPRGKITGLVNVEARTDSSETVTIYACPTGSFDNITDATFLAANGDSDASDGIQITLGAGGSYTLNAVPVGVYDIFLEKEGWLTQRDINVIVQPYSTTQVDFYNADRLKAGDCAGYDDDGESTSVTLPDNQINGTDHQVFESAYEATPADTNWNVYCDVDADSEITINDIHYSAVNAGNGEGLLYKGPAAVEGAETLTKLIVLKESKNTVTYGIVAENFPALQAYSVKVFIDGQQWKMVECEDQVHDAKKIFFENVSGYYHDFVCAAIGNIGSKEMNPVLVSFTLESLAKDAADPEISKVMLVDVYHRLNNPTIASAVEDNDALPTEFNLSKNYPNPFNPTTSINFALPKAGHVTLTVFNMLGQEVRTLVSSKMSAGNFKTMWDAHDDYGMRVSSGVYFYRLQVDDKVVGIEKMLLLK
jgi:hypothetical protein